MPKRHAPSTPETAHTTVRLSAGSRQTLQDCREALEHLDTARRELGLTMYPPRSYTADDVLVIALRSLWEELQRESRKLERIRLKRAKMAVDPMRGKEVD